MSYSQVDIHPSASRTATGETTLVDSVNGHNKVDWPDATFYLSVTAVTGAGAEMDLDVVATIAGVDFILDSFTKATGVTTEAITVTNCPKDIKAEYTIGGTTPDITFQLVSVRG